jgi:ATP-binding cassette subfamily B multidrug efflux pump
MKQYLPFFKAYKKALLISTLLVMADVFFEIVQPALMSRIVDHGIQNRNIPYILQTGGLMVFLSLLAIVANAGNIYYSSVASVGFVTGLRKSLFQKILQFSFSNIDQFSTASLTTRMTNDAGTLQEVVMMSLRLLIRSPLMLVSAVIIAIHINRDLAGIIAVAIPVLAISIYFILRKGIPLFIRMQQKMDRVNGAVQENLTNVRVVKSFVRENSQAVRHPNDNVPDQPGIVIMRFPVHCPIHYFSTSCKTTVSPLPPTRYTPPRSVPSNHKKTAASAQSPTDAPPA